MKNNSLPPNQGRRVDSHHILFPRKPWESTPNARHLRLDSGLIVPLNYYIHHNRLHNQCPPVTLPMDDMLGLVRNEMRFSDHPLGRINNLLLAMDKAIKRSRRFADYKRRMMELTMEAVEMQIPFIKEGLPRRLRSRRRAR